jgi:hypothetical protein
VPSSRSFAVVAKAELENMRQMLTAGHGHTTYADYTFAINKYLLPFFGATDIGAITEPLIRDFEAWRVSEMGKVPAASTKRNHASAFNRVIRLAVKQGLISDIGVPVLDASGKASQARPAFTDKEIDHLLAYMTNWELGGRMQIEKPLRRLCRAYVEFLIYTGARHGTEALPLRWRHLQWHWIGDKRYLRVW